MKYVVIGNSTAAAGCVEGIRQVDAEGDILIISDEPHHIYSRPLISYLLCGKTDAQRMKYRGDDFYAANNCRTLLGVRVEAVSPVKKELETNDGQRIPYDKLLIAAGSRPFVPSAEGYEEVEHKFTFMSLDDALSLEQAIAPHSRVLIVGAGLIGLKCVEGLHGRVAGITVVDLAPRVLSSILDEQGAAIVQSHLEDAGVEFILGTKAVKYEQDSAMLENGREVPFDILVMAAGVLPNTELFAGEKKRGIVTDEHCRTSIPDIYAAGDCAESMDITCDAMRVLALLPNAYMQGECAGINMAGGDACYTKAIPMNAIGFLGLHMITAGSYVGQACEVKDKDGYKKLYVKDGRLVGYIIVGDVRRAGIYTALIRERTPLSSIDFELIVKRPQLMAFSRRARQRNLGGTV